MNDTTIYDDIWNNKRPHKFMDHILNNGLKPTRVLNKKLSSKYGEESKGIAFTPREVMDKMLFNIPMDAKNTQNSLYVVLYTVELAIYLKFRNVKNVILITMDYDKYLDKLSKDWCFNYMTIEEYKAAGHTAEFILGNPPYQGSLYQDIVYKTLDLMNEETVTSLIVPSTFVTGPGNKKFRKAIGPHLTKVKVLKMGTFKDENGKKVRTVPSILYFKKNHEGVIEFERLLGHKIFKWTDSYDADEWYLYLSEAGKSIMQKALSYHTKFNMKSTYQNGVRKTGPGICVGALNWSPDFSECENLNAFDDLCKRNDNLVEIKLDRDGSYKWRNLISSEKGKGNQPTRFIWNCDSLNEAENLYSYVSSRTFNLLFLMLGLNHHNNGPTLGKLPYIVIKGEYSDERIYDELGLNDEERNWIETFTK
jgi:hypothetical protein